MSTRYGLSLKLDCDNAAFEENRAGEIARVLRELATDIECNGALPLANGHLTIGGRLFDANGNKCGEWEAKPRRIRD
jgi:hypothetical protein